MAKSNRGKQNNDPTQPEGSSPSKQPSKTNNDLITILDTTDIVYILLDINYRIIYFNRKAIQFSVKELNYIPEKGDYLPGHFFEGGKSELIKTLEIAGRGETGQYELSCGPDSSLCYYQISLLPVIKNKSLTGFLFTATDITEKKKLEADLLNAKVQEQKNTIRAVINAEEVERNKIGLELHDNVNQILTTIRLHIAVMQQGNREKEVAEHMKSLIDLAIGEIRNLCRQYVTPPKKFHLKEMIESLLTDLNQNPEVETSFYCDVAELNITDELKLNIYRIIQEQTINIIRYAKAKRAIISVKQENRSVYVTITDDGKGFDPVKKRKGIGLSNIINRTESYNGTCSIESSAGNGCVIDIVIPLK